MFFVWIERQIKEILCLSQPYRNLILVSPIPPLSTGETRLRGLDYFNSHSPSSVDLESPTNLDLSHSLKFPSDNKHVIYYFDSLFLVHPKFEY